MAIICPECEEKIPSNSKECPECGADIDISVRYNPLRVTILVIALSLIFFVAIPSIIQTLFFSEPSTESQGEAVPLEKIKEEIGEEQILKLLKAGIERTDESEGSVAIRWKVTVRNNAPVPILYDTDVRLLDEAGEQVAADYVLESEIPGSVTRSIERTLNLSPEEADRIKSMRAIAQPVDDVFAEEE